MPTKPRPNRRKVPGSGTCVTSSRMKPLTWPPVAMLLDSGEAGFDALVAPGHVATVMGPEEWHFVVDAHRIPAAMEKVCHSPVS